MLTRLVEETKTKCAQYWPEEVNGTETYGQFTVTLMEEKNMLNYVIRTMKLQVQLLLLLTQWQVLQNIFLLKTETKQNCVFVKQLLALGTLNILKQ